MDEIDRAIDLIDRIDDLSFRKKVNATGSIGEQFRHNLDFLHAFLKGIAIGKVDYTDRERDRRVETCREYAIDRFEAAKFRIGALNSRVLQAILSVRSELGGDIWLVSSVGRELEFVLSHTIHHHALIGEKLAGVGIEVMCDLGVSPSTREHRMRLAA